MPYPLEFSEPELLWLIQGVEDLREMGEIPHYTADAMIVRLRTAYKYSRDTAKAARR